MLKIIRRCFDFARSVFLSGRAGDSPSTDYSPTPYWLVKEAAFANLKPGTSTRDDVLRELGVPMLKSQFPRQAEEVWEYRYLQGTATFMLAHVYFDSKGTYKYSSHMLDPAEYGGG
ncbi:MAG: outer membrane protein assembly factor BamE [Betaproteobacteria bacterium]|nr:outer membrane protein assembly factor BamE [Betaproteobacteria bacterium]